MKTQELSKYYLEEAFKYIEMVTNPYEKAKLCLYASEVLATIGNVKPLVFENGEEAIKTENAKVFEPVEEDDDPFAKDEVQDIQIQNPMSIQKPDEPNTTQAQKIIGIDPETKEEIDITQAYNVIDASVSNELKKELAEKITSYGCIETYKQLKNVSDSDAKAVLADNIVQFGYDTINKVLYDFNDQTLEMDIYDFINNNNVSAFNDYIDTNWDDIDAKYPS